MALSVVSQGKARRLVPVVLADVGPEVPVRYMAEGVVLADELTGIFGEGDAGKSTLLYAIVAALVTGLPLFGRYAIHTRSKALIVTSGEDGAPLIRNRIAAFCAGLGLSEMDTDIALSMIHVVDHVPDDLGPRPLSLDDLGDLLELQRLTAECHYGLICFDPIADLIGDKADTMVDRDARRIYRNLRSYLLTPNPGLGILVAGHATKSAEGRTKKQRVFGSAAWVNGLRQCWFVERRDGGFTMDSSPKGNRRPDRPCLQIERSVTTDEDGVTWTSAALSIASPETPRVSSDVAAVLNIVGEAAVAPGTRDLEAAVRALQIGQDRASAAIAEAKRRGWIESPPGRARAWTLSEAGRVQRALNS